MHKLLILSKRADEYCGLVEAARLPQLSMCAATDPAALAAEAFASDLVFGDPSAVARVLPRLDGVRWVQATWAGVEPLLDPALRRDYILTNARGVFGPLMSEYVFGYMLAHERRIIEKYETQKERRWDPRHPGTLRGKRLGLIGVGTIGAALARTAKHFGMHVSGYTRASEDCPDVDVYFHGDDLTTFVSSLDYLVAIAPNTLATRGLVDARVLSHLPSSAVFINPGRGSIVDESALAEALANGRLAGAALDVFQAEPLAPESPLWTLPNVAITSHTAAISFPEDITPLFVANYRRLLAGEPLRYRVDFEQGY
ncbi:MAG TPA: D-2-hydroxyacid dehydrogenase [Vicinamibacterales bacterium]